MRRLLVAALLLAGSAASGGAVPRGRATPRPRPTLVVIRPAELDARGVAVKVAPGVAVATAGVRRAPAGRPQVTLVGPTELTGKVSGASLGLRVLHDVELHDASGKTVVGTARAGALVVFVAEAGGAVTIGPVGPMRGRWKVPSDAVGAEAAELVLPVPEGQLAATVSRADLRGGPEGRGPVVVSLDPGARVDVLAKTEDGQRARVRTYGALSLEGWLPAAAISPDAPVAGAGEGMTKGLKPTHEALLDVRAFADRAGKTPIGVLHGGALMTVGVEKGDKDYVKVMTHGETVAEIWVSSTGLRPLDPSVWAEGP